MSIYIGPAKIEDYSAMRGPCPEGYHVPSDYEWNNLYSTLITSLGLASNGTTMRQYLKMPPAGYRKQADGGVTSQGSRGDYRSCTALSSTHASYMQFTASSITPASSSYKTTGISIRGFKNSAVVPDSSWTTLYDGSSIASGAGIFHNATLGLISISGNGTKWYTIQDKNLGASVVYNSGDTLSESNCGYYYQRGNNYGFAYTGDITTSSTRVSASGYGPGNYYSSSTFVIGTSSWDTSNNPNLWGGQNRTPSQVKNVYIGEYLKPREPGINTLAYWPFEKDMKDYSGNGRDWSIAAGSVSYADNMITITDGTLRYGANIFTGTGDFTILWYRKSLNGLGFKMWDDTSRRPRFGFGDRNASLWNNNNWYVTSPDGSGTADLLLGTMIRKDNSIYYYENGVLIGSNTLMPSINITGGNGIQLGGYGTGDNMKTTGTVGNLIVENIAWTTDDILDYHRRTKAKYGMD